MVLYQVQGIVRIRKRFFGITWKTYEAFYDSYILPKEAAERRAQKLRGLCCEPEILKVNDVSEDVIEFTTLRVAHLFDGSQIAYDTVIRFESAKVYKHRL
jgi:hypothetical protein